MRTTTRRAAGPRRERPLNDLQQNILQLLAHASALEAARARGKPAAGTRTVGESFAYLAGHAFRRSSWGRPAPETGSEEGDSEGYPGYEHGEPTSQSAPEEHQDQGNGIKAGDEKSAMMNASGSQTAPGRKHGAMSAGRPSGWRSRWPVCRRRWMALDLHCLGTSVNELAM